MTCQISDDAYHPIDLSRIDLGDSELNVGVRNNLSPYDIYSSTQCLTSQGDGYLDETEARCVGGLGNYKIFEENFERDYPLLSVDLKQGKVKWKKTQDPVPNREAPNNTVKPSPEYRDSLCEDYRAAQTQGRNANELYSERISRDVALVQSLQGLPHSLLIYTAINFFKPLPPQPDREIVVLFNPSECH